MDMDWNNEQKWSLKRDLKAKFERQRASRIFDDKTRLYGRDFEGLDRQIELRNIKNRNEKDFEDKLSNFF